MEPIIKLVLHDINSDLLNYGKALVSVSPDKLSDIEDIIRCAYSMYDVNIDKRRVFYKNIAIDIIDITI